MAAHSSILIWKSPWAEEPGGLQSMGSQRVGHDRVTEQQQSDTCSTGVEPKAQCDGCCLASA